MLLRVIICVIKSTSILIWKTDYTKRCGGSGYDGVGGVSYWAIHKDQH